MKALVGQKLGMTQIITDDGSMLPVTIVEAGPMKVTRVKTEESDGYNAVQIAYGESKKISKPLAGQMPEKDMKPKGLKEFKTAEGVAQIGDAFDVSVFEEGDKVKVTGTSKGKGFAGTVKRWNFRTSAETHGGNGVVRRPGSIGSMYPQKVFRGKKMAGQLGGKQVSVSNLKVAMIDKDKNLIGLVGAVPGPRKGTVYIQGVNL